MVNIIFIINLFKDLITSLPTFSRIKDRFESERRNQNLVEIRIESRIRKNFHNKNIFKNEIDRDRRAKKQFMDKSKLYKKKLI